MGRRFDDSNKKKKVDSTLNEIKVLKTENEKVKNENKYLSNAAHRNR